MNAHRLCLSRAFISAVMIVVAGLAAAGPNSGGTVFLSWNAAVPYQTDPEFVHDGLTDCASAVVEAPPAESFPPPDNERIVWFAYAAFRSGTWPRLKGVSFGIKFSPFIGNTGVNVLWAATEKGVMSFPSPGWPDQPNSGVVLVFPDTRTGYVQQLCVFAGYGTEGARFGLGKHPSIDAQFADDSMPPVLDDIAEFGVLGFGVDGYLACPRPALGACCGSSAACVLVSPADCASQWGDYLGDDIPCEPNPCPGGCCADDGTCEITSESDCLETGRWWTSTEFCYYVLCASPPPRGACCDPTGTCSYVREAQCQTGDWRVNLPCEPSPCADLPGACCDLETGECAVLPPIECEEMNQRWMGTSSVCDPSPCPAPQAHGACCLDHNVCTYVTEADCSSFDWRPHEVCFPNPCLEERGACCFADHHCEIVPEMDCPTGAWSWRRECALAGCEWISFGACCNLQGDDCVIRRMDDCLRASWTTWWVGEGTSCEPDPCDPPPPGGACCSEYGSCNWMPEVRCSASWLEGEACQPNPCPPAGTCCTPDGCLFLTEAACEGNWLGDVPCDANPCGFIGGACCRWNGHCEHVFLEAYCHLGEYLAGVPCDPNPCPVPTGACCYPDGRCVDVYYENQCPTGDWHDGVLCNPNPCSGPPSTGACCHLATGMCSELTEEECAARYYPHSWAGAASLCQPNPCPGLEGACCSPLGSCAIESLAECAGTWIFAAECDPGLCAQMLPGACCYPNGHCYLVSESMCSGSWTSAGVCQPNPCAGAPPDGACCNQETGSCTVMSASQCGEQPSSLWFEGGCAPNPCPPPPGSGACCRPDGECRIVLPDQCVDQDTWVGGSCQPNPCRPVPTERLTWGRIKARFR